MDDIKLAMLGSKEAAKQLTSGGCCPGSTAILPGMAVKTFSPPNGAARTIGAGLWQALMRIREA